MKKPKGLIVLAIFSMINIGFSLLGALSSLVIGKPDEKTLHQADLELKKEVVELKKLQLDYAAELIEKFNKMNEAFMDSYYSYQIVLVLIFSLGLTGVILMLRRNRIGFHLYITYSILGIAHLYLFASPGIIPTIMVVMSLVFSGLFIFLYARFLPWINLEEV